MNETQVIKTVSSAYFIYLPATDEELSEWLNLAHVREAIEYKDGSIKLFFSNSSRSLVLSEKRAKVLKIELTRLCCNR